MTEQDKVTVDDIIGIVKTEEQTNSVEEVRKLRGRENKTAKRFTMKGSTILENGEEITAWDCYDLLNKLSEENERLKEENNKLHTKIFEMRTNIALERTEISKQTYTGKRDKKEYLDAKEFLDEIEKW